MKNLGANTYNTGDEWPAGGILTVFHDPIAGTAGWNLIGGYETNVLTENISTIPSGLQTGPRIPIFIWLYSCNKLSPWIWLLDKVNRSGCN